MRASGLRCPPWAQNNLAIRGKTNKFPGGHRHNFFCSNSTIGNSDWQQSKCGWRHQRVKIIPEDGCLVTSLWAKDHYAWISMGFRITRSTAKKRPSSEVKSPIQFSGGDPTTDSGNNTSGTNQGAYLLSWRENHLLLGDDPTPETGRDILPAWQAEIPGVWAANNPPAVAINQVPRVIKLLP